MPPISYSLAAAAALAALCSSAPAAPLILRDGGVARTFETAVDEIAVRSADGRWRAEKPGTRTGAQRDAALVKRRKQAAAGEHVDLILYESGVPRTEFSRRWATPGVLAILLPGTDAAVLSIRAHAAAVKPQPLLPDAFIFSFTGPGASLAGAEALAGMPGVISATPLLARQQKRRWTPNDPYFAYSGANAGYQWHLHNTGQNGGTAGIDVNITTAWDNWRGSGVRIGIMDDGLQVTHPDLSANCDTAIDYDWNGSDNDPSPSSFDHHGTSCGGVAAGRGNNGSGITGAAPEATLVGMRLISTASTDETESAAFLHRNDVIQVKSNSWGPDDLGSNIEGPGPLTAAALASATTNGRGGLGTVITWAAGNGRSAGDDSNFDGYANSIHVIAVGALTDAGDQAYYSESGANVLITAPSDGGAQGITTVDLTGSNGYNSNGSGNFPDTSYTNEFGGTSSACPLAAGSIAVLLQSKPGLGWRDVKEILLRSATKVNPSDAGWFNNASGFHWNDKFGAGLLNVTTAVDLAAAWNNLGPMLSQSASASPGAAIPEDSPAGAVAAFHFTAGSSLRTEQVAVAVNITHDRRGQLELYLTSPSGTVSKLARTRPDISSNLSWTFTTPQFWGEPSEGTWTLRAVDTSAGSTGTLNNATLTVYGTTASTVPYVTSSSAASGLMGTPFNFQATASNSPNAWSASGLPPGLIMDSSSGLISGTPSTAGTWTATLSATNASGTGTSSLLITVTVAPPSIAASIEAEGKSFTQSATPWFSQTSITHDGIDAAQSGAISHSASTWMETSVTGPATVAFWWQVSSELQYDKLSFFVDGTQVRSIDGEVAWQQAVYILAAGTHTLRWSYTKDVSVTSGSDTGQVDLLTILPQPAAVPLTAAGVRTGFQEPAIGATAFVQSQGFTELGWSATGGRVAEAGNRNPPLTGTIVSGSSGLKSFLINNASSPVTLTTDAVDLSGFTAVSGSADVRTYATTNSTSFETTDNLRIFLELSNDLASWTSGPEILPMRTGGSPDNLIALNTASVSAYQHFTSAPISGGHRYARLVVTGMANAGTEYLIVDNLSLSGTPAAIDADGDGYSAEVEAWFGTSDAASGSSPLATLTRPSGTGTVTFSSVAGNAYAIDASTDLVTWTTYSITATAATTVWSDPAGPSVRRCYRVRKP